MPNLAPIMAVIAAVSFFGLAVCHTYEALSLVHKQHGSADISKGPNAVPPTVE